MAGLRAPRVRGRVLIGVDVPAADAVGLLRHVAAELKGMGCTVRVAEDSRRLELDGVAVTRYSPLAPVDGGTLWLAEERGLTVLRYDLSTSSMLAFCAVLSPVFGGILLWQSGDLWLAAFGLVAPVGWLYGANYVTASIRVPALLGRLCRSMPR